MPLYQLKCELPEDEEKVEQYKQMLLDGQVDFPPLVCVNRTVIDGRYRFYAYLDLGYEEVKIYQNVPWALPAAA